MSDKPGTLEDVASVEALKKILGPAGLREFLGIVAEESAQVFGEMRLPSRGNDVEVLWKLAHKLKGILGGAGATELVDACTALQEAARQGDKAEAARVHALIGARLQDFRHLVEEYLRSG